MKLLRGLAVFCRLLIRIGVFDKGWLIKHTAQEL
jgi:hypothetical protein